MVYLKPAPLSRTCTLIHKQNLNSRCAPTNSQVPWTTWQWHYSSGWEPDFYIFDHWPTINIVHIILALIQSFAPQARLLYCSMCAPLRRQHHDKIQCNNHPPLRGATALQWLQYIALHCYAKEDLYLSRGPLHNPTPKISLSVRLFIVGWFFPHHLTHMF